MAHWLRKPDPSLVAEELGHLCNGEWVPTEITAELIIELAHRLISGSAGLLVLGLSIWAWKAIGHKRETKPLAILSVSFLLLQALIGAAAVMWPQTDFVLALHFGISLNFLCSSIFINIAHL